MRLLILGFVLFRKSLRNVSYLGIIIVVNVVKKVIYIVLVWIFVLLVGGFG